MSKLENPLVSGEDNKRSISVKAKLRNAFVGIAAFSLLAAAVGIVSYEAVDSAQQDIIAQALPAARHVEQLVQEAITVVDITPALLTATDAAAVALQRQRIDSSEQRMRVQLPQLRDIETIDAQIARFKNTIDNIFSAMRELSALVDKRNAITKQRNLLARLAADKGREIMELLRPAIVEATTQTFQSTDHIRSQMENSSDRNSRIIEQFDQLMDVDVHTMQRLTSMRAQTGNLVAAIEALLLSRQPEAIARTRSQLNIHLRALGRMTFETRDLKLRAAIGQRLRDIARAIRGPDNLLEGQTAYLAALGNLDRFTERSRSLRGKLTAFAEQLKKAVDDTIAASTARAEQAIWYGRISLVSIAVLAFLSAIWVIWRYVLSDVAARLDRIAHITRRLARGDLDVAVDVKGTDELGEVADAMRLFKANAVELNRSNAELEQFAYVASHDLKAPLRGISNLAAWIEEDLRASMTAESKKHLDLLKNRIGRLSALLEDLLQYSRAGRQKSEVRTMNLQSELPELFRLVSASDRFELELASPMPTLDTATAPLEQVFRNLLSNALKHHDNDRGIIRVNCEFLTDRYEFTVADDGPGIAPEYQDRIFGMFQTIRARDEVEGSGIGLSIAKKLAESVGCRIWVTSDPTAKRGAAIHFTWPIVWPKALDATDNA